MNGEFMIELKFKKQSVQKEEAGMCFLGRTCACREGVKKGKVQLKLKLGRDTKTKKGVLKVPCQQKET